MKSRWSVLAAVLALVALASGVLGPLGAHEHAFGEVDRVAHSLFAVDHGPVPKGAHHVERATQIQHPVCGDCLLVSIQSDRGAEPQRIPELVASQLELSEPETARPRLVAVYRGPARAPPVA